jgi:poly(A) polymerase
MRTAGVLTEVLPETEKWGIDLMPALIRAERQFGWNPDPLLRLAAIVPPVPERLKAMAERLKMSGAEKGFFSQFSEFPDVAETMARGQFEKLLYEHGSEGAVTKLKLAIASAVGKGEDDLEALRRIGHLTKRLEETQQWQRPVFPLKGADLLARGIEAGPEIGNLLERLEQSWVASGFALSKDELLASLNH